MAFAPGVQQMGCHHGGKKTGGKNYTFTTADCKRGWRAAIRKVRQSVKANLGVDIDKDTAALLLCRLISKHTPRTEGHENAYSFPEGEGHGGLPLPGTDLGGRWDDDPFA